MSFYSSLIVFYPGRSPQRNLGDLRNFCDLIRSTFPFGEKELSVRIDYEVNDDSKPSITWNESNIIGIREEGLWKPQEWDYTKNDPSWQQLWPETIYNDRLIRHASVTLGALPQRLGEELTASSEDGSSYIIPVKSVVSMGPVTPASLDDDLPPDECYGNIKLSFSGMGYFTWQPLGDYWKFARQGNNIQNMLRTCRDVYPAPPLVEPDFLKERLGELFLNQEEYRTGDWIVSVSESG